MPNFHPWSDYIIKNGLLLACALLSAAIVLLVWASAIPATFPLLRHYAAHFQSSAAIVLTTSLLGGLFLEDILRKSGS